MAKRTTKTPEGHEIEVDEPDAPPQPVQRTEEEAPPPNDPIPGIPERGEVNELYAGETDPAQVIKARNIQRVRDQHGLDPINIQVPEITELDPSEVEAGSPDDITLTIKGTAFSPACQIIFNGNEEPTTHISDTEVNTIVKPSLFVVAAVCPVLIRSPDGDSNSMDFTFTDPVVLTRKDAEEEETTHKSRWSKSKAKDDDDEGVSSRGNRR